MRIFIVLLLALQSGFALSQTGFSVSVSGGYRMPLAPGNLDGREASDFIFDYPVYNNELTATGSYGRGAYGSFSIGYTFKKIAETGVSFTWQQSPVMKLQVEDSYTATYRGSSASVMPYIKLRKQLTGPFIPYITFGLPVAFTDVYIEKANTKTNRYSKLYYPRETSIGISGGFGLYTVASNRVQVFFETRFTGLSFKPDKYNINDGQRQTSMSFPFSSWGAGLGIRYNINKMLP